MAPPSRPPRRDPGPGGPRRGSGRPRPGGTSGGPRRSDDDRRTGGAPRRGGSGAPSARRRSEDDRPTGPPRRSSGAPSARRRSEDGPPSGSRRRSEEDRPRRSPASPPSDARTAKWGGVARRGARNLEDPAPGSAAAAWRKAADEAERARTKARGRRVDAEDERWIDDGQVRDEAAKAVARGAGTDAAPVKRRRSKELPSDVAEEVAKAAGPNWAARVRDRLNDAARAYEAERYRDARRILEQLLERAPSAVAVRELLGLTYYRMGKWRDAIRELGAVELITGSVDHHPVIADCHRALHQLDRVEELWDELRRAGASVEVVVEGRIVMAGALADAGRVADAVKLLEAGPIDVRKPQEHHLRLWYALAALYEQAGDVPRARSLFTRLVNADPEFADALDRLESLGG